MLPIREQQLTTRAQALRAQAAAGALPAQLAPELFALFSLAAQRALGLTPYDEQLIAGLAMAEGKVVQMQTGEGKTLAAVAPVALHALRGTGAHVLTFNDYLAQRDAAWMGPIYRLLGLSVAHVAQDMSPGATRGRVRRRRHLRHRQGGRLRSAPGQHRAGDGRAGAAAVCALRWWTRRIRC